MEMEQEIQIDNLRGKCNGRNNISLEADSSVSGGENY